MLFSGTIYQSLAWIKEILIQETLKETVSKERFSFPRFTADQMVTTAER